MEFLSASKLKGFKDCPYQVRHQKFVENEAVHFGRAVHAGLAEWLKGGDYWDTYNKEARKYDLQERMLDAKAAMDFAKTIEVEREGIITVESEDGDVEFYGNKYFQVPITQNWGLRGAMDLVFVDGQGRLVILDWKTGQTKEEDDFQLSLYALAAWKKYGGFEAIKTIFAYTQQGFIQTSYWDEETLIGALEYIKPLAERYLQALKQDKWERTPHSWCKYCDFKDTCEAFQKQLEAKPDRASYDLDATLENLPKIIEYHDKIKAVADAAYSVREMLKAKYEEILLEYGKQNIGGRTYEIRERVSRYDYDLETIFGAVGEMIGRAPLEICQYSSGGMKELLRTLEAEQKKIINDVIKEYRTVKSTSKTLNISIAKEAMQDDEN